MKLNPEQFAEQLSFEDIHPDFGTQEREGNVMARTIPMGLAAIRAGSTPEAAGEFGTRLGFSSVPMSHIRQFEHQPSKVVLEELNPERPRLGAYNHGDDTIYLTTGLPENPNRDTDTAVHELGHALHIKPRMARGVTPLEEAVMSHPNFTEALLRPHTEGVADAYMHRHGDTEFPPGHPYRAESYRETGEFPVGSPTWARYEKTRGDMERTGEFPDVILPRDMIPPEPHEQLSLPGSEKWGREK